MSLHLVLEIEEVEEEDEGKGTVKMIQFIQRAVQRLWFNFHWLDLNLH